jgi:lipopolysaccharide biosynthesis glycosyltransferase
MNPKANILLCFDEKLIFQAKVLVQGLSETLSCPITVHAIVPEIVLKESAEDLTKFANSVGISFRLYIKAKTFDGMNTGARAEISYQKFVFETMLPSNITHLLYLDIDILPVGNLDSLFDIKFPEAFAGTALDDFRSRRFRRWESVVNGGVQLFNTNVWTSGKYMQKAIEFMTAYQPIESLTDEIVLNHVLYDEWKRLSSQYNFPYVKIFFLINPIKHSTLKLVHFIGPRKPWTKHWTSPLAYPYLAIYKRRAKRVCNEQASRAII